MERLPGYRVPSNIDILMARRPQRRDTPMNGPNRPCLNSNRSLNAGINDETWLNMYLLCSKAAIDVDIDSDVIHYASVDRRSLRHLCLSKMCLA